MKHADNWKKALLIGLAVFFSLPALSSGQDRAQLDRSWAETKREIRDFWPNRLQQTREWIESLRIARKPDTTLDSYEEDPRLWLAVTSFYDYIKGRELDVWEEQQGIPTFFPTRETYYDFLDTILPAMRDRRFERNRLLSYEVHSIEDGTTVDQTSPSADSRVPGGLQVLDSKVVTISIVSDDTLPFGKTMIFRHSFHRIPAGWYPGKLMAEDATLWERIR